jgi:predicted aspartyl protease
LRRLYCSLLLVVSFPGFADPGFRRLVNLSIPFCNDCDDSRTLVIPIRRVQNLIVIEARIDTMVGNFILDTGSGGIVLNKTYFRQGWELDNKVTANVIGTTEPVMQTHIRSLSIKDLYVENVLADLSDLGHIENRRGIRILGLLGVSIFTSYEMVIDLYKGELYLNKPEEKGVVWEYEKLTNSEPILRVPFDLTRNIITLQAAVNGKNLTFCLDTGAETNALSNLLSSKVLKKFSVSKRILMLGVGGSRTEVLLGTLDEFSIGSKSFKNMNTAIARLDDLGKAYGRSIDGILGNNFLVKGIISINFITHELSLYPFDVSKR